MAEEFPVGIDLNGRAVLLYLAVDSDVGRFRAFVQRHFELLRSLPAWTLRIVVPSWPSGLGELYSKTATDEATATLRPALMNELRRYFAERRKVAEGGTSNVTTVRFAETPTSFTSSAASKPLSP